MASNRKNQSGAVRFVPAVKAVLLCTLIGGSCVGYVLQKNKIYDLGQQIGVRQQRLEKMRKENQALADRLASLQTPQKIAARVKELQLGLGPPQRNRIIWIAEPAPSSPLTNHPPLQYVQGGLPP
jgi:cell division protein FtsB